MMIILLGLGIAVGMGVLIPKEKCDSIDILKDIEVARHALDKKETVIPIHEVESEIPTSVSKDNEVPLLEWLDEDPDEENFILVQSKKKLKKKVRTSLGCLEKEPYIRSTRTTPSVYRQVGEGGGGRKILLQKRSLKSSKNEYE
jgi:hypothetical protein